MQPKDEEILVDDESQANKNILDTIFTAVKEKQKVEQMKTYGNIQKIKQLAIQKEEENVKSNILE